MKNISLLIIGIIFCFQAYSQDIQYNPIVDTFSAKGMQQLTAQTHVSLSQQMFHTTGGGIPGYYYYRSHNILYYYRNDVWSKFDHPTLETNLNIFVKLHNDNHEYVTHADIINVNGIRFSIINYTSNGDKFISYRSDYYKGKFTYGYIQYKEQDEEEAQQLLKTILPALRLDKM